MLRVRYRMILPGRKRNLFIFSAWDAKAKFMQVRKSGRRSSALLFASIFLAAVNGKGGDAPASSMSAMTLSQQMQAMGNMMVSPGLAPLSVMTGRAGDWMILLPIHVRQHGWRSFSWH